MVVLMEQTEVMTTIATPPRTPGRIARFKHCIRDSMCWPWTTCPYNNWFYLDRTPYGEAPITAVNVNRTIQQRGVSLYVPVDKKYSFKGVDPAYRYREGIARIQREIQFTQDLQGIEGCSTLVARRPQ